MSKKSSKKPVLGRFMMFLVILVAMISACGGDKDAGIESSDRNESRATQPQSGSATPIANTGNSNEPAATAQGFAPIAGLSDYLVYVQGVSLYLTRLDGTAPVMLKENIHPPSLALIPDGSGVVYTAIESIRARYLTLTNIETLESRQIFRTSSQFSGLGPLSPNEQWAIVFHFPFAQVVRLDGTGNHRLGLIQGQGFTPFWLADNTVLLIEQPFDNNGVALPLVVRRFDPAAGEDMAISGEATTAIAQAFPFQPGQNMQPGPEAFVAFQSVVQRVLEVDVMGILPLEQAANLPQISGPPAAGLAGTPQLCGIWQVTWRPVADGPEAMYSVSNTLFLNNVQQLEDGSLILEHWYNVDCDINQRKAALVRVSPEGIAEVLTDTLDPGTSINYGFFFADTGPRTSLSSNRRFVAWIGGGLETGVATLNITDLQTNHTYVLMHEERGSTAPQTFLDHTLFNAVLWFPHAG